MAERNYSRQREAIYNYLMSTKEHPTAEMIYEKVRQEIPNISVGTVYRNLSTLEEEGRIIKLSTSDNKDRYDADTSEHAHFECRICKKVHDLHLDNMDFLKTLAQHQVDGKLEFTKIRFLGVCNTCGA